MHIFYMYIYHSYTLRMIPRKLDHCPSACFSLGHGGQDITGWAEGPKVHCLRANWSILHPGNPQNRNWDVPAMKKKAKKPPKSHRGNNHCKLAFDHWQAFFSTHIDNQIQVAAKNMHAKKPQMSTPRMVQYAESQNMLGRKKVRMESREPSTAGTTNSKAKTCGVVRTVPLGNLLSFCISNVPKTA